MSAESKYRVGGKAPLNVYEGGRLLFQCHTPEEAQRIVAELNQSDAVRSQAKEALAVELKAANFACAQWELTKQRVAQMEEQLSVSAANLLTVQAYAAQMEELAGELLRLVKELSPTAYIIQRATALLGPDQCDSTLPADAEGGRGK